MGASRMMQSTASEETESTQTSSSPTSPDLTKIQVQHEFSSKSERVRGWFQNGVF